MLRFMDPDRRVDMIADLKKHVYFDIAGFSEQNNWKCYYDRWKIPIFSMVVIHHIPLLRPALGRLKPWRNTTKLSGCPTSENFYR